MSAVTDQKLLDIKNRTQLLNKFSNKLFFSIEDNQSVLLDEYISQMSDDIEKLKSINLSDTPIFYTNKNIVLKLESEIIEEETNSVDNLKSLVESYVFSNIKLQKEK